MTLPLLTQQNPPEPPDLPGRVRVNHSQMLWMQENSDFALYSKIMIGELSPSLFIVSSYFIYQLLFKYLHLF